MMHAAFGLSVAEEVDAFGRFALRAEGLILAAGFLAIFFDFIMRSPRRPGVTGPERVFL
jgi:hypothetical protein